MNTVKKSVLIAAIAFAGYGTVQAQVTTSSIQGVVAQASGASVTATHLPSGTVYTGTADNAGGFTLPNMRVGGPYRVEITKAGEAPEVYDDIYLELGVPFVLNTSAAANNDGAVKTTILREVAITGTRSKTNINRTGAATNVGQKTIQELPQINRSITDFTKLTPQANGTSFAGRDARYNNLQIDGANFNNGFGLSTNPLPGGGSQPISLDAIEEITVNIAPFDVTQSGFTGAGINAVTKSGTNKFHGSLYGYYNGKDLNGWKINGEEITKLRGAKTINGLTFGGPILKNKLFFFVSGEMEKSTGANASGANLWKASQDGVANTATNTTRVLESDLIAVRNHLINRWNYDPGRYQGYADEAEQHGNKFLARIDWNINPQHKLAVRYNYLKGESMQVANGSSGPQPRSSWNRVSENAMTFENGNYSFTNEVQSVTAELNSTFSNRFSNKFLFTYSKIQDTRSTPSGQLFPFVDIWKGGGNYISFGTELFSYLNDMVNDNYSFINNITYNAGKHAITGGIAYEIQKFGNSYTRMGTGYYRYNSVEDFLKTGTPDEVAPINFGLTYPYAGQETYARVNFGLGSLYVQDKYSVTDRFNFTIGLRAELPFYLNDLTANPAIDALQFVDQDGNQRNYYSSKWPDQKVQLSPRFGFNFDALGDRSLIFRGGTGIFYGRIPFVWLTNMPTNAGVLQNTIEPSYESAAPWIGQIRFHPEDIYYYVNNPVYYTNTKGEKVTPFISSPSGGAPGTIATVDDKFKMPAVWRSSLGIDYKIPNTPVTFTTDILYTKDVNAVFQYNPNRKPSGVNMTNMPREFYPAAPKGQTAVYQVNPAIGANNVTVLTNTNEKGHAFSVTGGFNIRPWHGLSGSASYTYSEAKDVTSNPGSAAGSAWQSLPSINNPNEQILSTSDFAIPHRVTANISYNMPWGTTIGAYYNGSNQGRFSYYYSGDINGDNIAHDLLYIPQNTADMKFAPITDNKGNVLYTAQQQRDAFEKYIVDNKLDKYRGSFVPRNAGLLPWLNRVDLRISQDLFRDMLDKGHKLQISLDIVNFGNMLNSDWGIQDRVLSNGRSVLKKVERGAVADPTFQMLMDGKDLVTTPYRPVSSRFTTWSANFGIKYMF